MNNLKRRKKSAGAGIGYYGSSTYLSGFKDRNAPSAYELLEAVRGISFACLTINMGAVASTPLRLYATTGASEARPKKYTQPRKLDKKRTAYIKKIYGQDLRVKGAVEIDEITEHPVLTALHSPCKEFDLTMLLAYIVMSMDVLPAAYVYIGKNGLDVPEAFQPMLGQYVYPMPNVMYSQNLRGIDRANDDAIASYNYLGQTYKPEEVLRFRHLSLANPYLSGMSPMQAAYTYCDLADKYASEQTAFLTNGGMPKGIFTQVDPAKPPPDDAVIDRILMQFNNRFQGANGFRTAFIPGSVKYTPMSIPPADQGGVQIEGTALERIAMCFGIPISFLKTDDVNRANAEAGKAQYSERTVQPRCTAIASAFTHQVMRLIDPRLFAAFDNPVPEDFERTTKLFDMRLRNASVTINEYRDTLGEPHVEWGDKPLAYPALTEQGAEPVQTALPPPGGKNRLALEGPKKKPPADDSEDDTADDSEDQDAEEDGLEEKKKELRWRW